jgi:hypothetical protein
MQTFEAEHRTGSGLDPTMILLDEVVQIFGRPHLRALGQYPIRAIFASSSMCNGLAKLARSQVIALAVLWLRLPVVAMARRRSFCGVRRMQFFYGNQGATSLPTTANRREHRNKDAFRRNGTRPGFSLTADWLRSAGSEFSVADLESARKSTAEVLSRFRIAATSSGLK